MVIFSPASLSKGGRPKTICLPSGDQLASLCCRCSESISCGVPPSADIRKILYWRPGCVSTYAICVPSGDQRGRKGETGGDVSCRRELPSTRLRQRVRSGKER